MDWMSLAMNALPLILQAADLLRRWVDSTESVDQLKADTVALLEKLGPLQDQLTAKWQNDFGVLQGLIDAARKG